MAFNTNASRLYVVKESTPGTIQAPASGASAVGLQPGFEFNPNVQTIQNEEIKASIGPSAPIPGLEEPTASFSHYLRGSAQEGIDPDYSLLLQSIFGSVVLFYQPIVVTTLNQNIDFTDDDGTQTAVLTAGSYKTPQLFAVEVAKQMNAVNGAKVAACVYNTATGKFKITSTGTLLSLLWKTGTNGSDNTNTSAVLLLGYTAGADKSGTAAGTGYTSDSAVNGIERVTTGTASTVSVINLASGGGASYARGKAVLVKNAVYEIRPVDSVATDALTLGFDLLNAPNVANIKMGQCIQYVPINSAQPTLSLWLYRANGAAIEAIQGALITQMDLSVDVGTLLNLSFQAQGTKFFFDPIVVVTGNKYLDIVDTGGAKSISVATGVYRDPYEFAAAIQAALTVTSVDTWTVTYNAHGSNAGKFTLASTGGTASLTFKTGSHGSDNSGDSMVALLGFTVAVDKTGAQTYTSGTAQVWADAFTPTLDSSDPLVTKAMEMLIGDSSDYVSPCVQTMKGSITLDTSKVKCIKADSGIDSIVVKKRTSTFEVTAVLEKHEAGFFDRFINNTTTKFCFNFGPKVNGNWVAGRSGCLYAPNAKITGYRVSDSDGSAVYIFTIAPFVDSSGNPEIYLNLL